MFAFLAAGFAKYLPFQYGTARKTATTDALSQRSLRDQFDFNFTGNHLATGFRVSADVRSNDFGYTVVADQDADAGILESRVITNNGQILDAGIKNLPDDARRCAYAHKATEHDAHAVA